MRAEVDHGLRAVFAAEHGRLWRSLLAYAGDPEVASEAAAEAFAQAVRRGEALRDPAAWVWRAAFRIAAVVPNPIVNNNMRLRSWKILIELSLSSPAPRPVARGARLTRRCQWSNIPKSGSS